MFVIPFVISYEVKEKGFFYCTGKVVRGGKNKISSYLAYNYRNNPSTSMVKMCYRIIIKEIYFILIEFLSVYYLCYKIQSCCKQNLALGLDGCSAS